MAKKGVTRAKKPGTEEPKKTKKQQREGGMGHNLAAIREKGGPVFEKLFEVQKNMDSDMGSYKAQFKDEYEKGANEIGCTQAILKREFRRAKRKKKEIEEEQQMEADERQETEQLRAAMSDTPFGKYLDGKLAKPAAGE